MTVHHSILNTELPEKKLRWMLAVSCTIHLIVLLILFGKPPDTSNKVYYSPVYSVSLVDMPPGPPGPKSGTQTARLLKASPEVQSQIKTAAERSHNIITVSKHDESEYVPEGKKRSADKEGPQKPQPPAGGDEQSSTETKADQVAPGGGGGGGGAANLKFSLYYQAIWNKIQQAWVLPPYDSKNGQPEAIVVITISRDGKILGMEFEKKSGDENLDNSVIRALKKADPLPPFPPDLKESVLEIGIRFIPEQKKF